MKPWTSSPIPPPPAIEMPQLSLAAQGIGPTGGLVPGSESAMQPTYSPNRPEAETLAPRQAMMTPVMPMSPSPKKPEDSDTPLERTAYQAPRPRKASASPKQRPANVQHALNDRPVTPVKKSQEPKRAPSQLELEKRLAAPNPFEIEFPSRRAEPPSKPPEKPTSNWKAALGLFVVVAVVAFIGLWVATGQQLPFLTHR
jgi:hypothetical protein